MCSRFGTIGTLWPDHLEVRLIAYVLREIANLRGSRGTLLEHSPVADSQSNGFIERGIRSVEEMTRVILFDLSSPVGSPISIHSPVFPWIVKHATDFLNKCHVESDGKSAYERLKRRQHRGVLLPFGAAVMFIVAGKVPGGAMTERWNQGTWLRKRVHTEEHFVARKGDGLVIRSRAMKTMNEETRLEDLDAIKGSEWAASGVLRDLLPDVPGPILSRDEPPFLPVEDQPVPRNMKNCRKTFSGSSGTRQAMQNAGNCRATNISFQAWLTRRIVVPGLRQQARQTLCIVIELSEQNSERWISTQRKWKELIIQGARRASLEPSDVPGPRTGQKEIPRSDPEGEDHPSARDARRARGEPEQDLLGEVRIPNADETLTHPEIPAVPSRSTPSSSTSTPISPRAS